MKKRKIQIIIYCSLLYSFYKWHRHNSIIPVHIILNDFFYRIMWHSTRLYICSSVYKNIIDFWIFDRWAQHTDTSINFKPVAALKCRLVNHAKFRHAELIPCIEMRLVSFSCYSLEYKWKNYHYLHVNEQKDYRIEHCVWNVCCACGNSVVERNVIRRERETALHY